ITGDSLMYIGDIDINISTSNCTNRTLTFSVIYLNGLAIDGDTIFTNLNPPTSYSGSGFIMTQDGQGHFTVTGNFNVVSLYSGTNILSDVCLVCETSVGIQMSKINGNRIEIYPNPTNDLLNLEVGNENIGQMFFIFDYSGKLVSSGKLNQKLNQINITNLNSGLYFIRVNELRSKKVIKFIRN
ncbi:MAG: T9SS type A sorting domain-containing protein, partial [Bacteroidia bacterium]